MMDGPPRIKRLFQQTETVRKEGQSLRRISGEKKPKQAHGNVGVRRNAFKINMRTTPLSSQGARAAPEA